MTIGFAALWKNTDQEYRATQADERGSTALIQAAFANGRDRGIQAYGLYSCRFSSSWQYFTFWVSPSMEEVFDSIADLERAGDFKFANSRHTAGIFLPQPEGAEPAAWQAIPSPEDELANYAALRFQRGSSAGSGRPPATTESRGIRSYGAFDCRFGSAWDQFSFWTGSSFAALESALAAEDKAANGPSTSEVVIGKLDRFYRFGAHLQTDLTWLEGEWQES
jgi:hypothetical protein